MKGKNLKNRGVRKMSIYDTFLVKSGIIDILRKTPILMNWDPNSDFSCLKRSYKGYRGSRDPLQGLEEVLEG